MGVHDKAEDKQGHAAAAATALNGSRIPMRGEELGTGFARTGVGGESLINGAFHAGDWALHHGGQLLLDGAGFIPGVNVVTELIQSGYHAAHFGWDMYEGNSESAKTEVGEAAWHAGLAGLNVMTGEGGKVAEEARGAEEVAEGAHAVKTAEGVTEGVQTAKTVGEGAQAAKIGADAAKGVNAVAHAAQGAEDAEFFLHATHLLADTSEAAWDLTATMYQLMSGDDEKLPFLGGLVPWIAGGAGREAHDGDDKER